MSTVRIGASTVEVTDHLRIDGVVADAEELRELVESRPSATQATDVRLLGDAFEQAGAEQPAWLRRAAPAPARESARDMRRAFVGKLAANAVKRGLVDEDEAFELSREFEDNPQGLRERLYGPQTAESDAAVRAEIAREFGLDVRDVEPLRREWARDEERLLSEQPPAAELAEREEIARTFGMSAEDVA